MATSTRFRRVRVLPLAVAATLVLLAPAGATAQTDGEPSADQVLAQETFARPPASIAEAALAPRYLNVTLTNLSPDKARFLDEVGDGPVTMDVFSKPFHELGGEFIDFAAHRDRRFTVRNNAGIRIISAHDGSVVEVDVPDGARVTNAEWSPRGDRVAYFAHFPDGTHIYVADAASGRSRQVTRRPVLATLATGFDWTDDGARIGTVLVPRNRAPMPVESTVPTGPQVKITTEGDNRLRTYASLMETPYDQQLLEWHVTGQVALIDVDSRDVTEVGAPTMVRSVDFAPSGEFVRVTRVLKPFSYIVPVGNFARVEELWDLDGQVLATLEETEMNLGVRDDGDDDEEEEAPEKRSIRWHPDGSSLVYLQQEAPPEEDEGADDAADEPQEGARGGNGRRADRLIHWTAPFGEDDTSVIYETTTRMASVQFSEDNGVLFVTERRGGGAGGGGFGGGGGQVHQYAVFLSDPSEKHTLARYDAQDVYENPGSLLSADGRVGGGGFRGFGGGGGSDAVQVSADGEHVFFVGTQYDENPEEVAPRTFIDRVNIRSGEKERIFESDNESVWESVTAAIDVEAGDLVVSRESRHEIEQSYRRSGGGLTQLTNNVDYTPDLTNAPTQSFIVERPDGFKFKVNVTLPEGYQAGTRLPAMFWFYPREYDDQEAYDRGARTFNKNAFPNFGTRSIEYLVRLGYAVVEPDAPIVGPSGQWNNNYEHDLRNNLAAVIDELDARELIDRRRIGIGGHSYGAFSTVNAMVHTPFFKAGIAGDGNYNRTLTPLSFQRERRILWEAKDVYLSMSPFLHANNLTGALLMYHGLHDQNVGTHPSHSPRLFHALNGLGKTASMYLYPFEDHGPATLETTLDLWARWTAWLDKYVKNADGQGALISQDGEGGT